MGGYPAWGLQKEDNNQEFYKAHWVQSSMMPPPLLWDSLSWFQIAAPTFLAATRDVVAPSGLPDVLVPALIGALVGAALVSLAQRRQHKVSDLGQKLLN